MLRSRKYFFLFLLRGAVNPAPVPTRTFLEPKDFFFLSQIVLLDTVEITFFDQSTLLLLPIRGLMQQWLFSLVKKIRSHNCVIYGSDPSGFGSAKLGITVYNKKPWSQESRDTVPYMRIMISDSNLQVLLQDRRGDEQGRAQRLRGAEPGGAGAGHPPPTRLLRGWRARHPSGNLVQPEMEFLNDIFWRGCLAQCSRRWNSWTAFLFEVSWHKLESSQARVFIWFSILIFSVVDPDPELFAGSGINHFGSGSGQSGSGMNLIPNFSVKK